MTSVSAAPYAFLNGALHLDGRHIWPSSEEPTQPNIGLFGSQLSCNFYTQKELSDISIEISSSDMRAKNYLLASIGGGYRRIVLPNQVMGYYLLWDTIFHKAQSMLSHVNIGAEYFNFAPQWKMHLNAYIPLAVGTHYSSTGQLLPEAFDIYNDSSDLTTTVLEKHYFLTKDNFYFDAKLSRKNTGPWRVANYFNTVIGLYGVNDRHGEQWIMGVAFGAEYQDDHYKVELRYSYDQCNNSALTFNCMLYNLGTPRFIASQNLCAPRERHLASPFIKTKNVRPLKTREEIRAWNRIPSRPTAYRQRQNSKRKAEEQAREWWKNFSRGNYSQQSGNSRFQEESSEQAEREKKRQKEQEKRNRERRDREWEEFTRSWQRNSERAKEYENQWEESSRSQNHQHSRRHYSPPPRGKTKEDLINEAYKFFRDHDPKNRNLSRTNTLSPKELRKLRNQIIINHHPDKFKLLDKNEAEKIEAEEFCKTLNNHLDVLITFIESRQK